VSPLDVEIRLNHTLLETVWIARMESFKGFDEIHEYMVGLGVRDYPPWDKPGASEADFPRFYHRYSDRARKCLQLALAALDEWEQSQSAL